MCASLLTHGWLVVAQRSVAVVVFEQRTEHLGAHLRLPLQRHVGSHHLIVCVQVVTERETDTKKEDISITELIPHLHIHFKKY